MKPVVGATPRVVKSEQEWREELSPGEYAVLREAGTEAPFTGEYTDTKTTGVYECRACGAELFRSDTKFESHCGWPSFYDPADSDAVLLREDRSMGMRRIESLAAVGSELVGAQTRSSRRHRSMLADSQQTALDLAVRPRRFGMSEAR